MKFKYISLIIAVFLVSALVYVTLANQERKISSDIIFSHKFHVQDNDIECTTCHTKVTDSKLSTDNLIPKMQDCYQCHDEDETECSFCHKNADDPIGFKQTITNQLKFNHSNHLKRGAKCENCHTDIAYKDNVESTHLPKMKNCQTCHEVPDDSDKCYKCHNNEEDLRPVTHNSLWLNNHGIYKETASQDCDVCHKEQFCINCHEGENLLGESHPPEFILTHSISFMSRESDCYSCHQGNEFCITCHTEINYVVPASHSAPNWLWPIGNSIHQVEGASNVEYCSACHRQNEPKCVVCHDD